MNDREFRAQAEFRIKTLEASIGQLESAFQIVWGWMIANKQFADRLPFSTVKPKEEQAQQEIIKPTQPTGVVEAETVAAPAVETANEKA